MRILFVKHGLAWPRSSGHDVHCSEMIKALAGLGEEVSLATVQPPLPAALAGLGLASHDLIATNNGSGTNGIPAPQLTAVQERFRRYWGIDNHRIANLANLTRTLKPDVVVLVGLDVLPYLGALDQQVKVWYAADEWVLHHLSQVRVFETATWENVRDAIVKGAYERAYAPLLDRVWVVSQNERRAMSWVAGARSVDVLPNGIDGNYFESIEGPEIDRSLVFWGRLDFGPNIQAIEWFLSRVWPKIQREAPDARFTIIGFRPTEAMQRLHGTRGISIISDLVDLRAEVRRHAVVVLPFVSGGGIKNKLLEAASLGKAIVCSPRACSGLRGPRPFPLVTAAAPEAWVREILSLWGDPGRRRALGAKARAWVLEEHSWLTTARQALRGLAASTELKAPL